MSTVGLFVAGLVFCLGVAVLWANPGRFTNQVYALIAALISSWLYIVHRAVIAGFTSSPDKIAWLRSNTIVAALLPCFIWLLKESIVNRKLAPLTLIRRSLPWVVFSIILIALCFSKNFIGEHVRTERGSAYTIYSVLGALSYVWILVESHRQMRHQTGIPRIELQFFTINFGYTSFLVVALTSLGNFLNLIELKLSSVFVFFTSFALTAWAITVHRIFDVQQVFRALAQRTVVIGCFVIGSWILSCCFRIWLVNEGAWLLGVGLMGGAIFWIDRATHKWFGLGEERFLTRMRRSVIDIATSEPDPEKITREFEIFLKTACETRFAALLVDRGTYFSANGIELAKGSAAFGYLCEHGWATPEGLQRKRATAESKELEAFISRHQLGLVLAVPRGSPNPSLLVMLGTKSNEWLFTYPEVQRVQNIAELMDNILTRSRLTMQAAMQSRMEHLSMMSRGLAHDLKNLITPVSSFLIHLDGSFAPGSAEGEVHAAARQSVRIMTDYVTESLFFSERLEPWFEQIDLARIFAAVGDVTAIRAQRREITVQAIVQTMGPVWADGVLLQRMLGNLVSNAIDASNPGQMVTLQASRGAGDHLKLEVIDGGSGIKPENLRRIFEPYFTTKEYGDDVRGFGLGLTICEKIAHLHGGIIFARSAIGEGTTMTVEMPVTPRTVNVPSTSAVHSPSGRAPVVSAKAETLGGVEFIPRTRL